jgi:glycosyltransferase involved in cell wall biosynthesis
VGRTLRVFCITADPDRPTIATFAGLRNAGVEMTVACPSAGGAQETLRAAGVTIFDLSFKGQLDRRAIGKLRAELLRGRYDILHLFGNRGLQNGLIAARGLSIRIVAYRGIVGNVSFFNPVSWMRFLNPRIDRIVCVCDAVRDYFVEMRPAFLRIPQNRLVRIYKGHSLDWYRSEPVELGSCGVPAGTFVVNTVANYRPRKGFEVLVEALERLPRELDVHLLIVGRINDKFKRLVARSPSSHRIHCPGHRSDAPALAAASDVFVLPSIRREGLARSLIEAMAYERPVIVTDCGGSPELVVHGESGIVVPTQDPGAIAEAIQRLIADPDLRRRLGAAARERIRIGFRIEDTIEQTLAMYRGLVAASS